VKSISRALNGRVMNDEMNRVKTSSLSSVKPVSLPWPTHAGGVYSLKCYVFAVNSMGFFDK